MTEGPRLSRAGVEPQRDQLDECQPQLRDVLLGHLPAPRAALQLQIQCGCSYT
jgi:hypothetical protein